MSVEYLLQADPTTLCLIALSLSLSRLLITNSQYRSIEVVLKNRRSLVVLDTYHAHVGRQGKNISSLVTFEI